MNPLKHVAIIMDGNGRWGLKYKNSRNAGHKAGLITVEKIIQESIKQNIKNTPACNGSANRRFLRYPKHRPGTANAKDTDSRESVRHSLSSGHNKLDHGDKELGKGANQLP